MGRNGNAPRILAKTTPRGVPLVSLLVTFVVGLIVFLPFPSWQQLVGFVTSATVLSFGAGTLVIGALRRELPERERPFRVPFGDVLPFLALYASNLIVYWSGWDVDWKLFVAIAARLRAARGVPPDRQGRHAADGLARRRDLGGARGWPGRR